MSEHVPQDLLTSFLEGDVSEQVAIHIAEHIDECPRCLNRATAMEPLALAFASLDDPEPPDDLVESILILAAEPDRLPSAEMMVGAGLLGFAGLLVGVTGNPVGLVVELGIVLSAVAGIGRALAEGLVHTGALASIVTLLAMLGSLATARFADLNTPTLTGHRRLP